MNSRVRTWAQRRSERFAEPVLQTSSLSIEAMLAVPAFEWDLQILATDPQVGRLTPEVATRAIALAVADGRRRAVALMASGGPSSVADTLGLPVVMTPAENRFGPTFQFAEYQSRPPRITVYRRAMDLLRTTIRRHGLASALGLRDPEPVYIAHEIYHHLDQAAAVPVARRSLVVSFAFGPLRLRSGLVSLAEIGATAFASEMTGLRCHPRLLDRLAHHALIDCPAGSSEMPCKSTASCLATVINSPTR